MPAAVIFKHPLRLSAHATTKPTEALLGQPIQLESWQLLQGRREVLIRHGDDVYRLRHTRNDKLILTK